MKKILVVSDVHGNIDTLKQILNKEHDANLKIFAGDLQSIDNSLLDYFDYVVTGNVDYQNNHKETIIFDYEGIKIMLTHGHLFGGSSKKIDFSELNKFAKSNNVNLIIHGHDHIRANESIDNILRFNPGSTTLPKDGLPPSYGILELDNKEIIGKHIDT